MLHTVPAFARIGEENAFEVLARATELQRQGKDIINLGIGQPDFQTPGHIVEAAIKALRDGHHGYTPAKASCRCARRSPPTCTSASASRSIPDLVLIVPGGKVTMFMAILMFGEPGAEILYPDPGFPDLPLDDRVHRRQAGARADPRGERLRLLRRRDAVADHAEDAACSSSTRPANPTRRRHAARTRSTSSSPASRASPTSRSCRTRSTAR